MTGLLTTITATQQISTQICEAISGNSTTTSSNDNSTSTPTSAATNTGASSSASSSSSTGSSAGGQLQLAGFGWAAVVGVVGYLAL